jgi:hypothetical protein
MVMQLIMQILQGMIARSNFKVIDLRGYRFRKAFDVVASRGYVISTWHKAKAIVNDNSQGML